MRAPCANCPDKGCGAKHASCQAYQEWSEKRTAVNKKAHAIGEATFGGIYDSQKRRETVAQRGMGFRKKFGKGQ